MGLENQPNKLLSRGTTDGWGQIILCHGGCAVLCRILSSTKSTALHPCVSASTASVPGGETIPRSRGGRRERSGAALARFLRKSGTASQHCNKMPVCHQAFSSSPAEILINRYSLLSKSFSSWKERPPPPPPHPPLSSFSIQMAA